MDKRPTSLHYRPTTRDLWPRINMVQGRSPFPPTHSDPVGKGNLVNDAFINRSALSNLSAKVLNHQQREHNPCWEKNSRAIKTTHYTNPPFTLAELESALKSKRASAPGQDIISYSMLRNCTSTYNHHLLYLYNAS